MAIYPGAVKTFTAKADGAGNKINAEHINALQDEVTAIEDGLLNGTAPLNSSRITAPALVVSAGSTLQTLQVAGASTFVGPLSLPAADAVRLSLAATQQIASNSTTAVVWTTQDVVTNSSMHSTTTDPTQVKFQSTGVYWCQAIVSWDAANSTVYQVSVEDSSGALVGFGSLTGVSTGTVAGVTLNAPGIKYVDTVGSTPFVRVVIRAIGSTSRLDATAGRTVFTVVKLR